MKSKRSRALILATAILWLPVAARAANVCNGSLDFTYPTGPNFAVPGSSNTALTTYTVNLALGAGSITGVANPVLTINRVRFDLDCVTNPSLPCTDQGQVVEYEGDSNISTDCPVGFMSNVPAGGSSTNEIIFTPTGTLTRTPNGPVCNLTFTIKVLSQEPGDDTTPLAIEEGAGYIQAESDATCNNGLSAGNQVSGTIPVCPVCVDTQCSTSACDQTSGQCTLTAKSDSGACTIDNAGNPVTPIAGACKTPGCEAGDCVRAHVNVTDSTACSADNSGNPVTAIPGACKTPGCEAGVCVRAHINVTDSTVCSADNSGNPVTAVPGACKTPGCEAGVCVTQHIPVNDSTACSVDNAGNAVAPIPGACKTPGCESGQCVAAHINKTDSTACSADNAGNPVSAIPGACKTPGCEGGVCVQAHIDVNDSTACSADNSGNPVTAIPGSCKTPGCESGVCVRAHINVNDSTACSADNSGNPVTAIAGACKTPGCESGQCVQAHINVSDSTACSADNTGAPVTGIDGACKTPGCESGVCVRAHINKTDSTACSADNSGSPVNAIPGACKTPGCEAGQCVAQHISKTDSTACSVDNSGNPVTGIPGSCKLPGCEGGQCVANHISKTDSTPCSVDASGNPVTPSAGCQPGCEAGVCTPTHVCQQIGCRITAGGVNPNGNADPNNFPGILKGTFGGQVGAPCGCIGCFDNFENIQGNWEYQRKNMVGNFHAMDFNSLVCGCDDLSGNPVPLNGNVCGNRTIGPTPRQAPANVICFSGVGEISPPSLGKKSLPAAFRVEAEDRGEPGAGNNSAPSPDFYRIRIWVAGPGEDATALAAAACCNNPNPNIRTPDIDDGGDLTHGNIQIHPENPLTKKDICPPPSGSCVTTSTTLP